MYAATHSIGTLLLQHRRFALAFSAVFAALFGYLAAHAWFDSRDLPAQVEILTISELPTRLAVASKVWANVVGDVKWECDTAEHSVVGREPRTEVPFTDEAGTILVIATFNQDISCEQIPATRPSGIFWTMNSRRLSRLAKRGFPFDHYPEARHFVDLCTVCSRGNSNLLALLFGALAIGSTLLYPLHLIAARRSTAAIKALPGPLVRLQIKWFAFQLQSKRTNTRIRSARALAHIRHPRVLPALVPLLRHDDASTRRAAVEALGMTEDPQAVEPLLAAHAFETDPYTRLWMAHSLAALGEASILRSLFDDVATVDELGLEDWDGAEIISFTIAQRLGKRALPVLSETILHSNLVVRWLSLMILGQTSDQRAIDLLRQAQHDKDEFIRVEAKQLLEGLGAE